jgi:predicted metalloprotease
LGGDPSSILSGGVNNSAPTEQRQLTQNELQIREFVRMLSKENNQTWENVFAKTECNTKNQNCTLRKCNTIWLWNSTSLLWAFYCPADQTVYMDMSFLMNFNKNLELRLQNLPLLM